MCSRRETPAPGLRSDSGEKAEQKQEWLEEKHIQVAGRFFTTESPGKPLDDKQDVKNACSQLSSVPLTASLLPLI